MINYKRSSFWAVTQPKCVEQDAAVHAGWVWASIRGLQLVSQTDLLLLKSGSKEKSQDKEIMERTVKSYLLPG